MRVNPLRVAAEAISPKIRRDRGKGLYIAYGSIAQHDFFLQERRGEWTVLLPSEKGAQALAKWLGAPDPFGFARFMDKGNSAEDIFLLCRGVKLLETDSSSREAHLYERDIRQRAALLLRAKDVSHGGALPLCMRIATKIQIDQKGD